MVEKMIVPVPTTASSIDRYQQPMNVSLPAPPFDLTIRHNDRDETRPRSMPIRANAGLCSKRTKHCLSLASNIRRRMDHHAAIGRAFTVPANYLW